MHITWFCVLYLILKKCSTPLRHMVPSDIFVALWDVYSKPVLMVYYSVEPFKLNQP